MDIETCKENIQPLRGGRNRAQLQVALEAQANDELKKELLQNKQAFEHLIRTYEGDDPLDNWYNYISWIEQSYPKHGHEGNLILSLEDCLGKFENDERYYHDRRFCKLWIKYIDLQQYPDELFQLLHSKGICTSCVDLYRAWSFYHEIIGDFKKANTIYHLGIQARAQPYEELIVAQKNMFMAAGRQMVEEDNYQQLHEQRQALTSLRTYKHKHQTIAPSVRVQHQVRRLVPGAVQTSITKKKQKENVPISVYCDKTNEGLTGAVGGFKSILDVARRQAVIKENSLKPGPWTIVKMKKKSSNHSHALSFKVHEDESPTRNLELPECIKLYADFIPSNADDFANWKIERFIAEPHDPKKMPMYPKQKVYCSDAEYSLEEIKAKKYLSKVSHPKSILKKVLVENQTVTNIEPNLCTLLNSTNAMKPLLQYKEDSKPETVDKSEIIEHTDSNSTKNQYTVKPSSSNEIKLNENRKHDAVKKYEILKNVQSRCSNQTNHVKVFDDKIETLEDQSKTHIFKALKKEPFTIFDDNEVNFIKNPTLKECNKVARNLFNETHKKVEMEAKSRSGFEIYCEEQPTISIKKEQILPLVSQEDKSNSFQIYQNTTIPDKLNMTSTVDKSTGAIKKQYTNKLPEIPLRIYTDDESIASRKHKNIPFNAFEIFEDVEDKPVYKKADANQSNKIQSDVKNNSNNQLKNSSGSGLQNTSSDGYKSIFENSIYKEQNTSILPRDVNFSFSNDRIQINNNEKFQEHVRHLLKMKSTNDGFKEIIKINKSNN